MTIYLILLLILLLFFLYKSNKEGFKSDKLDIAVIVEPRQHKFLVPVVKNIIKNVPEYTKIQIFHGTDNLHYIKKHFYNTYCLIDFL